MNVKFWSYNRFVWLLNHTVQLYTYMNTHAWTIHACIPTQSCTGHHHVSSFTPFYTLPSSPHITSLPFSFLPFPHPLSLSLFFAYPLPISLSLLSCPVAGWACVDSLCGVAMNNDKWAMGSDSHILSLCQSRWQQSWVHTHALAQTHFHRVLYMTSFIYHCMQLWSCRTYAYMYAH